MLGNQHLSLIASLLLESQQLSLLETHVHIARRCG